MWLRRLARVGLIIGLTIAVTAASATRHRRPPRVIVDPSTGVAIYERGVLADGSPLQGERANAPSLSGVNAACINCHRKSGLGSIEARNTIPPITARYLFHPPQDSEDAGRLPYLPNSRLDRDPYTAATLARAIREGLSANEQPLSYLMPRYALSEADMGALVGHLLAMDPAKVPGVSSEELHFATIVTPDADPVTRAGVLDVIRNFVNEKNSAPRGAGSQKMQTSAKGALAKHMFRVNRLWVLHVWELTGPASTWQQQLTALFAAEPVFAVISGAYGGDYTPIRAFCEAQPLPCLFPNLESPPNDGDGDFHTVYFSRGVGLEADLIAHDLSEAESKPPSVVAVYREGDVGAAAAARLAADLSAASVPMHLVSLPATASPAAVRTLMAKIPQDATLVLWLRPKDLATLGPAHAGPVYLSGILGDYENAPLPSAWRPGAKMVYNIDLPLNRRVRLDYAHGWFRVKQIPEVAFRTQADTLLACGIVSETVKRMIDAFIPDYLVERIEDSLEHRALTGYYPRLTLGTHQRFASKGGYFVRFSEPTNTQIESLGDWVVP
ncbi:MAG: cytochrome C [Pseudomonadota bacterium]|jgi:hypothetical protein